MSIRFQEGEYNPVQTVVFWDIVDFHLEGADEIERFVRNLTLSLQNEGYLGEIRIRAYYHREPCANKNQVYSIHPGVGVEFVGRGSRFARHSHMLVDLLRFRLVEPQANFMLIMKGMAEEGIEFVSVVKDVKTTHPDLIFVLDDDEDVASCAYPPDVLSDCDVWRWTSLLKGEPSIQTPPTSDDEHDDDHPNVPR